ncbi:uncharacterized protein [Rutidosis leptorrhynchoides]|uniref:uncharacterized protein n=1 Tax=Rutidosis leptorrhynchoides TaxID=125765 RepID=UPI003A9906A0
MNTSQFMDKQIMDLSSSQNKINDFTDLNSQDDNRHHDVSDDGDNSKDEILPNYDFQPIRPIVSSQVSNFDSGNTGGARVWSSAESKPYSAYGNFSIDDSLPPFKLGKDPTVVHAALLSEIDRTMKKHVDNLMHALEGVSARLSQLESRSRNLENAVDDLKMSVGNNYGSTDGKLRQIENIIREVQSGVQVVKDKQEIFEAQLQLAQVQISKPEQQPEPQVVASAPMQSYQQLQPAAPPPQSLPPALPNAPPPPPPVQHPNQYPPNITQVSQHDSYYQQQPGQTAEPPAPQQYQMLPPQHLQQLQPAKAAPPSPQAQYQQPNHTQYSQPPPMSLQHLSSQSQPPLTNHSEELSYLSSQSQSYQPLRQPSGGPPPQQFQGNPSQMYEPPAGRPGPGFPNQHGPSAGFGEPYNYSGSQYGSGSPVKSQQHSPPNMGPGSGSGSGYPQLPTARILPQALPTATAVGGGSSSVSGSGGNRVPIDDVVDKVTNMGFPRDQVRATVRKLTENGQAVDLNVVLDKLMTDGVESQNPRAWFGR